MEYSIQEVAKAAGTTSRTLRHYDSIGLVKPARVGCNGYRYYDDRSLVRLQRVLLLRELGLGLDAIAKVLRSQDERAGRTAGEPDARDAYADARILEQHLEILHGERDRIDRQLAAVERTIAALSEANSAEERHTERNGLMEADMFDGFDHTQYKQEVEERWGADAYASSDAWWRGMSREEQRAWQQRVAELSADWAEAAKQGTDPASEDAQKLAARHAEWLRSVPGTPASEGGDLAAYLLGLGEMYVADERFGANYGGVEGATFVRDALRVYVERGRG